MSIEEYNYYFGNLRELRYDYLLDNGKSKYVQKYVYKNNGRFDRFGRNQRLAFIAAEKMRNQTDRYYKKLEEQTNRLACRQTNSTTRWNTFWEILLSIVGIVGIAAVVYIISTGNIDLEVAFKLFSGK